MGSNLRTPLAALRELAPFVAGFAVIGGLSEAGFLLLRRAITGQFEFMGTQVIWMAPVGYLLAFGALALGLAAAGWVWRPLSDPRTFALLAGAGWLTGLLHMVTRQRVHLVALLLLAAGLAVQLYRVAGRERWRAGFLRAALAGWAMVPLLSLAAAAGHWSESPPARAGMPNILLIVWDTVRDLDLSLHGYERPTTPALEEWAARGVVFERAFAPSSWTLTSHASLFTGRFPHELSVSWLDPLDATFPTLAEVLAARGYRTGGFVANLFYTTRETGLARGFETWQEYPLALKEVLWSTGLVQAVKQRRARFVLRQHSRKKTEDVVDDFLQWQDRTGERPFFAFLNFFDAHIPFYAPDSLLSLFGTGTDRDRYNAAIAYLDRETGRLLRALERRGVLRNTIVVITSDHGEQFGGHGLFDHGNSLYRQVIQVPLVLLAEGRIPAGLRVPQPVSLRNVPATVLDLAGEGRAELPGTSHTRFWREPDQAQDEPVLSTLTPSPRVPKNHRNARGEIRSLVRGSYHYIEYPDGRAELFDVTADPGEVTNRAYRSWPQVLGRMVRRMDLLDSLFPRELPEPEPQPQ